MLSFYDGKNRRGKFKYIIYVQTCTYICILETVLRIVLCLQQPKKTRERETNWSNTEKEFLRECINMHLDVVEHKGNDTTMIVKKKNAWKNIRAAMVSAGYDREIVKLKSQWVRMKVSARKAVASMKRAYVATGNSVVVPEITEEDNLVQSMLIHEFQEDDILIDSNCISDRIESPPTVESLSELQNIPTCVEKDNLANIGKSPVTPQQCLGDVVRKNKDFSPSSPPLKCPDDIIQTKTSSSSKLKRLRSLPKTTSQKNNIVLERQRQIAKESLQFDEINKLQKRKLIAEIEHEEELHCLKMQHLRNKIEHEEELHVLYIELFRKKCDYNSK